MARTDKHHIKLCVIGTVSLILEPKSKSTLWMETEPFRSLEVVPVHSENQNTCISNIPVFKNGLASIFGHF